MQKGTVAPFLRPRRGVPPCFPIHAGACPLISPSTPGRGSQRQLAYKSSYLFQKLGNSWPRKPFSGPFHLQKLVVAPGNRNWKGGWRAIDPRFPAALSKGRSTAPGSFVKGEFHASRQLYLMGKFWRKRRLLLESPKNVDISSKKRVFLFQGKLSS